MEALSHNHCCRGKAKGIKNYECVPIALVMLHAKRMRRIILSSVASLALPYFSRLSHKVMIFGKTLLNKKGVL